MPKIDFGQVVTAEAKVAAERNGRRDEIRRKRDRALNAGVTVRGMKFHTDDFSQQRIYGAAVAVMRDPSLIIKWKTVGGAFVPLDSEELLTVADAVRAHVQACYDREAELLAELDAGNALDMGSGWPG